MIQGQHIYNTGFHHEGIAYPIAGLANVDEFDVKKFHAFIQRRDTLPTKPIICNAFHTKDTECYPEHSADITMETTAS